MYNGNDRDDGYVKIQISPELDSNGNVFRPLERYKFSAEPLKWLFMPIFDELPLGLLTYLCVLFAFYQPEARNLLVEASLNFPIIMVVLVIFFVWVAGLSWLHVFSSARKLKLDRKIFVCFASFCCFVSGFLGGYRLYLYGPNSLIQLFGAWNMLQGIILTFLVTAELVGEKHFSDRDTPVIGALANFAFISFIFFAMKNHFCMHPIDNFSICVAYTLNFSEYVCNLISPPGMETFENDSF